mmetsp:Transcript_28572/g.42228  ORF Transcript_28572/g.42228 Transcript_28572/m.42228 type:complete len:155 (-) Transcript_28572:523-987(-)
MSNPTLSFAAGLAEDKQHPTTTSTMVESAALGKDNDIAADAKFDSAMDNLKIDTTRTDITETLSSLSDSTDKVVSSVQNPNKGESKCAPYDADTNPLCGGDFVYNLEGGAVTIAFLFQHDGKLYCVTVGHLKVMSILVGRLQLMPMIHTLQLER